MATGVSSILAWYAFIFPRFSFIIDRPSAILSIVAFAVMGIVFSLFREHVRRLNQCLAAQSESLRSEEKLLRLNESLKSRTD